MFKSSNSDKIQQFYNQILTITEPVHHSNRKSFKINHSLYKTISKYQPRIGNAQTHRIQLQKIKKEKESVDLSKRGLNLSVQKIYNNKKSAYKTYIRDIYIKINEQLRKKNNFLAIASQTIRHIDYSNAIISKEVKPLQILQEEEEHKLKKRAKERIKILNKQVQNIFMETMKQKMKSTFKIKQDQKRVVTVFPKKQKLPIPKTDRQMFKIIKIEKEIQQNTEAIHPKLNQRRRERIYSLNSTNNVSNKINVENFIPSIKAFNKKQPFLCGKVAEKINIQQKNKQKILFYVDFIWKVNYANGLFVKSTPQDTVYRAYVGPGNNSNMVKSILKRRFWWNIAEKPQNCNFVWTQLKINSIFKSSQRESHTSLDLLYFNNQEEANPALSKGFEQWSQINFHTKIFNSLDFCNWICHIHRNAKNETSINQRTFLKRVGFIGKKSLTRIQDSRKLVVHNHLEHNYFIGNKKALFYHMKKLYKLRGENIFAALPVTFHVSKGIEDPEYKNFIGYYNQLEESKRRGGDQKNIWILKPGQFSNRGNGITVCHTLDDIVLRLKSKQKSSDGTLRTFILQKYIQKPLLYKNRKFDIRHYLLLTCFNGIIKAYWYPQGYIRTASAIFSLKRGTNMFIHLTNDAIQQHSDEYGKYQKGNKISYERFQAYLDKTLNQQKNVFYNRILPEMKQLSINAVKATYLSLDQKRRQHNFELLGMDFMIDGQLKPWLIQINTNPCLELSCPLLARLIPALVQNTFQICVDTLFPPPEDWPTAKKIFISDNTLQENRFELIFDESSEGKQMEKLFNGDFMLANSIGKIQQDADIYEGDGVQQWQGQNLNHNDVF